MIYCVWYPSGGFGHYINAVLNTFCKNFARPKTSINFSHDGNCHAVNNVAPGYRHNQNYYSFAFNQNINYSITVDNGINDENTNFVKFFPDAKIIKICYTDFSWPLIASTMINKALQLSVYDTIPVDKNCWPNTDDAWITREKFFLFLRDHNLRQAWKPLDNHNFLLIEDILNYHSFRRSLINLDLDLEDFSEVHQKWLLANARYIDPVITAYKFVNNIDFDCVINDTWTQSMVYYFTWCAHGLEIPHNDFEDFFQHKKHFVTWLENAR